jgi:zinc/manganese transport system ATP-binding protein
MNGSDARRSVVRFTDVAVARGGREIWSEGTFEVPRGCIVGVIGPNGSGKTTFLKLLLGLLTPSTGSIEVLGETPRRGNPRIGYVPQNYTAAVGDAVRCRDLVHLSLLGTRWGVGQRNLQPDALVDEALAAVDATGFANERMSQVSGGQQQRVAIAAGLVNSPDLLLLDEPLANLDMRNQRQIAALLGRLATERNMTVFVVAHQLNSLLEVLTSAVYLLDEHAHYDVIGKVVDEELLSHLYGTSIAVVRTPQGDLFTRNA